MTDPTHPTPSERRDPEAAVRGAFQSAAYFDSGRYHTDLARGLSMVGGYFPRETEGAFILAVEFHGQFTVTRRGPRPLVMGARFDALLSRPASPETLVIRDYKTGRFRGADLEGACVSLAVARANLQPYSRIFRKAFTKVELEYDYLGQDGLLDRVRATVEDVRSLWPEVKAKALRVYEAEEFPAEPGEHCIHCPLFRACQPRPTLSMEELDAFFAR